MHACTCICRPISEGLTHTAGPTPSRRPRPRPLPGSRIHDSDPKIQDSDSDTDGEVSPQAYVYRSVCVHVNVYEHVYTCVAFRIQYTHPRRLCPRSSCCLECVNGQSAWPTAHAAGEATASIPTRATTKMAMGRRATGKLASEVLPMCCCTFAPS